MGNGVPAAEYHERTKHTPQRVRESGGLDFTNKPRPYKAYADLPTVSLDERVPEPALPALRAVSSRRSETTDAVDLDALAGLCYYAAGITSTVRIRGEKHAFRAAACTGALYHVDLYLVCGDVEGLDAGVYHFDPRENALERLREGAYRGVLADASGSPVVADAPVTVVATSTWWRNAWKYHARTYRHAFWDSGTVLANLQATARALDLPSEVVAGFADGPVSDLLGVDPEWEAPLELVAVGGGDPVSRDADGGGVETIDPATEPLASDPVSYPLVQQAWEASALESGDRAEAWRDAGDRPVTATGPGGGDRIDLDPVGSSVASSRPLHATVRRRGSCRDYERDALSFRKVSTVLDRAMRPGSVDVLDGDGPSLQLVDCYCLVNGVDGLEPGAYQYHPDAGALELLHAGEYRRDAGQLALGQQLGADAAVCVYFLADLDAVTEALGDRGYRAAQLEAALAAGRLYLATYAHRDLGGTGLTFFDDAVTEFFEPRSTGQTPMFLYTLGRPA